MSDGTLRFDIEMDTEEIQKGLKKVEKEVKKNGDTLEKTTKKTNKNLNLLKNTAKVVGTYLVSKLFKESILKGVEFNRQIEQYTTSFEVMTGSAEKSVELMEKLTNYANKTPFDTVVLADTTQLLMNYGIESENVMGILGQLGDIAQGSGEKLSGIAMAYGQMSSLGKVTLEDVKQMIERGFNPLQEISQSTGESMESLYGRISKGTLSVDEITASMKRSTEQGGKYFGSMDKQSQTLDGQLSTLSDTFESFLGDKVRPLSDYLRDDFIPMVIKFLEDFDLHWANLMTFLEEDLPYLVVLIGGVATALWAFSTGATFASIGGTILSGVIGVLVGAVKLLYGAFQLLTTGTGWIILGITLVVLALMWLVENWEDVLAYMDKVSDFLNYMFNVEWVEIFGSFGEIIKGFFKGIQDTWEGLKRFLGGIVDFIKGVFSGNWEQAFQGLADIVGGVFNTLTGLVKTPLNAIIGLVNGAIRELNKIDIKIPSWVPFVGGSNFGIDIPLIPYLEKGGILAKGQVGFLEGNGAEAVVPLDRNKHWVRAVAKEMAYAQGSMVTNNNGQTVIFNKEVTSISEVSRRLRVDARLGLVG